MITCKPNVFFNLTISLFNPLSERSKTAIISNNKEWKPEGTEIQGTQKTTGKRKRKDDVPVNTTTKSKRKKDVFRFFGDLAKDIKVAAQDHLILGGIRASHGCRAAQKKDGGWRLKLKFNASIYEKFRGLFQSAVDALPLAEDSTVIGITAASLVSQAAREKDSVDPDVVVFSTQRKITSLNADEDCVYSDVAGFSKRTKRNRGIHEDRSEKKGKSPINPRSSHNKTKEFD
ncbi:hypothetical protein C8J55DRAFT_568971 [Lentinula edodes]|uniref:Uncharacterized protein n=1 Tax=Lentinula lateritia TaxID=40482 RepID=A0A9W9E215_9AGAR|nr:hypothetical protein C8J55DRAFT_568971 [Lentinula edodes]